MAVVKVSLQMFMKHLMDQLEERILQTDQCFKIFAASRKHTLSEA